MKVRSHCPPAPGALPLLGHSFALMRDPLRFLETASKQGPLVRVQLGPLGFHLANDPELVQRIQVDGDNFERGRSFDRLQSILGVGAIAADGPPHRQRRAGIQSAFGLPAMGGYVPSIIEEAEHLTRDWRSGDTIDLGESLDAFASRTILRCMYGPNLAAEREDVNNLSDLSALIAKALPIRTLTPAFFTRLPIAGNRRFKEQHARFLAMSQKLISMRGEDDAPPDDILSRLLTSPDPYTGQPMTEAQVHAEILGFLVAGIEASGTTLAWAFQELVHHPDAADRVSAEAQILLEGTPDHSQVKQLTFTQRVLREVMRLHSVLLFTRTTRREVTLAGVRLAPGTELGYSLYYLHRDPALYPDPLRFDPDRPGGDSGSRKIPYMVFGTGAHQCLGAQLAMTIMTLTLAKVLSQWTFRAAPGASSQEVFAIIPRPGSLTMVVERRVRTGTPTAPREATA